MLYFYRRLFLTVHLPTEELIERFVKGPGGESDYAEFKDLAKVATPEGRRDLVKTLSAFANGPTGGTCILGVGRSERGTVFQTFDPNSEVTRDLMNTIRSNTRPAIDYLVKFIPEEQPGGRILRIDVRPADKLVFFRDGRHWRPFIRAGDTTIPANSEDILRWANRKAPVRELSLSTCTGVKLKGRQTKRNALPLPRNRLRVAGSEQYKPVFGWFLPFMPYRKNALYRLEERYPPERLEDLAKVLQAAQKHLEVPVDGDFSYSMQVNNRIHGGLSASNLLEDAARIREITEELGGHPEGSENELPRVSINAYAPFRRGIFWIQMDWRHRLGRAVHGGYGLILEDIPFDPRPLQGFFAELKSDPGVYQQTTGLQIITVKPAERSRIPLRNVRPLPLQRFERTYDFTADVIADNPFFGRLTEIEPQFDEPVPKWLVEALCSVEQLPFFTQGGVGYDLGDDYFLQHVEVMYASLAEGTYFVNGLCWVE